MGFVNPDEMLRQISARQFAEWTAYLTIEPFGYDQRKDLQQSMTPCILANAHRGKSKQGYRLKEFMQVRKPPKPQSASMMKTILKAFVARFKK